MISAMCELYLVSKKKIYLNSARNADVFIQKYLCAGDTLHVSFHMGKAGVSGFLDDYAAYVFAQLSLLSDEEKYQTEAERQLEFVTQSASQSPANHAMFLRSLLEYTKPPMKIIVVPDEQTDKSGLPIAFPPDAAVILSDAPTKEHPLKNGRATYYVCKAHSCLPPTNDLNEFTML